MTLTQGTGTKATVRGVAVPAGTVHFGRRLNTVTWSDGTNRRRISVAEAATLQTFPHGFPFRGSVTAQFEQVGNAIPPVLAAVVLDELGATS